MGTRSTVRFYSEHNQNKPVMNVYNQFDGYISGVGADLGKWLKDKKICNGFNGSKTIQTGWANGMGCLAAQFVAEHKKEIGGFYLTTEDDEQEYNYEVRLIDGEFIIKVGKFQGSPEELLNYEEPEDDEDKY